MLAYYLAEVFAGNGIFMGNLKPNNDANKL